MGRASRHATQLPSESFPTLPRLQSNLFDPDLSKALHFDASLLAIVRIENKRSRQSHNVIDMLTSNETIAVFTHIR
jgi:hypothetical protein